MRLYPRLTPLIPALIALLLVLVLTGCEQPRLTPIPPDGTLFAFGDSLTQGVGADPDDSYPAVLARLSGRTVINAGVSGEVTEEGRARFGALIAQEQPDLVLLLEGGNDILRNLDPAQTQANLAAMIEQAQAQGISVVLIGWAVAQALALPPELLAGMVLVGAAPGGTASNVICCLARSDVALSISLTAASTLSQSSG